MFKPVKNAALITVGTICLIVGVIGIILPFLPGTPFLLLATACFNSLEA